jgi:hypothetical protein
MMSLRTLGRRGRRTVLKLIAPAAVLAAAAALAQPAAAMPPTRTDFGGSGAFPLAAGTLCSFSIDVHFAQEGTVTRFFDDDGALIKQIVAGREQDTFSANGKTLVGDAYHFTFVSEFENGVRVDYHENGIAERVPLPNGGVFIVAGRVDLLASGSGFVITVDSGNSGNNLEAFCAALS